MTLGGQSDEPEIEKPFEMSSPLGSLQQCSVARWLERFATGNLFEFRIDMQHSVTGKFRIGGNDHEGDTYSPVA